MCEKMKMFGLALAITVIIFSVMINAALAADANWKKIWELDNITGYVRPNSLSCVDEIKAIGIVNAPIAVVEAVIRDVAVMPQYIFLCKEAYLINTAEMKSAGDVIYFYSLTDLPFPVNDRDAVAKSNWSVDKQTGAVYCHAEAIKTTYGQRDNVVRMPLSIIDCTLIPRGSDKTEVIYQALGDPGGELPSSLVSMLTRFYGIKTIAGLRQMVKKDKYRNVKKVVTKTFRNGK